MTAIQPSDGSPTGKSRDYPGSMSPGPGDEAYSPTDSVELIPALRRHWPLILTCGVVALLLGWALIPHDSVVHRATASVTLDDSRRQLPATVVGTTASNVHAPEFLASQAQIILSQSVLGEVVDREGLRFTPSPELPAGLVTVLSVAPEQEPFSLHFRFAADSFVVNDGEGDARASYGDTVAVQGVSFTITSAPPVEEAEAEIVSRDAAIAALRGRLRPAIRERGAIIDVAYTDADPVRAVEVVNAATHAYRDYNIAAVQEQASKYRQLIGEQLTGAEARLAQAQRELEAFRHQSPYYSSRERLGVEQAELLSLDTQREQLQADHRAYVTFLRRVERGSEEEIDQELRTLMAGTGSGTSPLLTQLFSQLGNYQSERDRLLAGGAASTNPSVVQLNTLIASTRTAVIEAASSQVDALSARLARLTAQRERTLGTLRDLPEPEAEETRLAQQVAIAESGAQTLRAEHQRALVMESLDMGQVEILDPAVGAVPTATGNRSRNLAFALLFGLLLGSAGAVAREYGDRSIRRQGEAEAHLSVPALGIIPPILQHRLEEGQQLGLLGTRAVQAGTSSNDGATEQDGYAAAADAYRKLRTNLAFLKPVGELRTLVVTSSSSADGKTTTAANLAFSFARQGQRVLLVDCDLRRPRLHQIFGIDSSPGFVELLTGRATASQTIVPTSQPQLFLLPRGEYDEVALELLSGSRMEQLVATLRAEFDMTIFDTSPLLLTADAAAVAAFADGVLLVVRAGQTPREALSQASNQLDVVGAELIGFVLNDPDSIAARHGDYYPDRYYAVEA